MWEWFKNGSNLQGLGSIVGGLGGVYGAVQQGKYAKDLINLQKSQYLRGIQKEDQADKSLSDAYANSTYNQPLVKLG